MRLWLFALALAVLAGCGGSGGSAARRTFGDLCPGDPPATLQYRTLWGSVPSQASQVVQLIDAAGHALVADSVNRSGAAESTLTFSAVPAGVYEVRASLYSLADASGQLLAVSSSVVDLCGTASSPGATTTTAAGVSVAKLVIEPGSIQLDQQDVRRFVATPVTASGVVGFLPPAAVTWSVAGGIGSVTSQGVFTAGASGSGQVEARTQTGLTAGAPVTVVPFNPKRGKWTILVFLNAANDLAPASDLNMNQMEAVAGNPDVRFVVQWKESRQAFSGSTFEGVRRYLVKPDSDMTSLSSELLQDNLVDAQGRSLDMGSPQTLRDFVTWGKKFYPADRTCLVIWNHGAGWKRKPGDFTPKGFSYDDQYGTSIKTWEIDQALSGHHVDILAWDASLMQMVEVAYEARNHASYIVGSEESPPADGYPYHEVFKGFRDSPNAATAMLTKGFVDGMVNNPPYVGDKITQSVLDTSKIGAIASALDTFGAQLMANATQIAGDISFARSQSQSYSPTSSRYYRDIGDVCRLILGQVTVPTNVKSAALALQQSVADALVWEGHNSKSPRSTGLSMDFSPGTTFQGYAPDYSLLKLAKDTRWDEFLSIAP